VGETVADENIGVQLARMEGKIDLVNAAQARSHDDIKDVRLRLHDTANEVTKLSALNIQDRFISMGGKLDAHEAELDACRADRNKREGALGMAKFMYGAAGAIGAGGVYAVLKLAGVH
jgi:hypothetical protein